MRTTERWRQVHILFYNKYCVSNLGRVARFYRGIPRHGTVDRWKILKHVIHPITKHAYVSLSQDGMVLKATVGSLVLTAFVSPCPKGHHAGFKTLPASCELENLEWRRKGFRRGQKFHYHNSRPRSKAAAFSL